MIGADNGGRTAESIDDTQIDERDLPSADYTKPALCARAHRVRRIVRIDEVVGHGSTRAFEQPIVEAAETLREKVRLPQVAICVIKARFVLKIGPAGSSSIVLDFGAIKVFAGRFRSGHAVVLRLLTGDFASLSSLPYIGSLIPPTVDLTLTDVGVFWASQNFTAAAVADVAAAQTKFGWAPFYPSYPNKLIASGMHAVARIESKANEESALIQRHLQ